MTLETILADMKARCEAATATAFDKSEPACPACGCTLGLKDGCEWGDIDAENLCPDCMAKTVLEAIEDRSALIKALELAVQQRDRTLISLLNSSRWSEYAAEYNAELAEILTGKETE